MTESTTSDPFDDLLDELKEESNAKNKSQKPYKKPKNSIQDLDPEEQKSQAQAAIMRYLARREYSKQELQQRLIQKGFPKETIHDLLSNLEEEDWQSDLRCAEMLLSHGYKSGWGPNKIRAQMQQKGIKNNLISEVFWQFEDRLFNYKSNISQAENAKNNILLSQQHGASSNTDNGVKNNANLSQANDNSRGLINNQSQIQKLQEIIDNYAPDTTGKAAQLEMLNLEDGDWNDKALAAAKKKFGHSFGHALEKDVKNKAKLQRFLYNKGFESEHISFVLKNYNS